MRRMAEQVGSGKVNETTPELHRLRAEYPAVFTDFPDPSAGTRQERLDALTSAGSRIALDLTGNLTKYARERYREGRYQDAVRVFGLVLVINPGAAAAVMHASALQLSHPRADFLAPARHATILAPLGPDDNRISLIREGEHTAWTAAAASRSSAK